MTQRFKGLAGGAVKRTGIKISARARNFKEWGARDLSQDNYPLFLWKLSGFLIVTLLSISA
jgi:hypothetical protein